MATIILIICTLGVGSAWAFDNHSDEAAQHDVLAGGEGHTDNNEDHPSCDHCCHFSAHTSGLWASHPDISIRAANKPLANYSVAFYSLLSDPPDHPPRS